MTVPATNGRAGRGDRAVEVEVPATSANLGAGYDVLALALGVSLRVRVEASTTALIELTVEGEGARELGPDRRNRFLVGLRAGFAEAGIDARGLGWRIRMENGIPLSRGMGSSAAATVAGLLAAERLSGARLGADRVLDLATTIEGHPDNAAAALHGGFVLVGRVDGGLRVLRLEPPPDLVAVLFVPERHLVTAEMRRVLPASVPHADAVFNASRVGMAVAAFATGDVSWLAAATEDRLHEPYRAGVFPALPALVAAARAAGALGACLSGAGSTVIAFARSIDAARIEAAYRDAAAVVGERGHTRTVGLRTDGATARLT
ncbi:MAG: homoserine kinase [Chloroflexi bacterium]|nr:homoserine kinase [Chloroflexota bacterium]